jgi:hypothetical protein
MRESGSGRDSDVDQDRFAAGLPKDAGAEVLTIERAYAIAIAQFRNPRPHESRKPALTLEEVAKDPQGKGVEPGHFDQFRRDFLAQDRAFPDPSGDLLDLLRRRQHVENAQRLVELHERLTQLLMRRVMFRESGLSQPQVDREAAAREQARQRLEESLTAYRDRLDEMRVAFGLAPAVAVIPDHNALNRFRLLFKKLDDWSVGPDRQLDVLASLLRRLPAIGDIVLDGKPVLEVIEGAPDRLDEVLNAATRLARQYHDQEPEPAATARALRVRRSMRRLAQTRQAYGIELSHLGLHRRNLDRAIGRILQPRHDDALALDLAVAELGTTGRRIFETENRLIDLWTSFGADRLAFDRELGTPPFADWPSFNLPFEPAAVFPDP